jgi:hypothetical protein
MHSLILHKFVALLLKQITHDSISADISYIPVSYTFDLYGSESVVNKLIPMHDAIPVLRVLVKA